MKSLKSQNFYEVLGVPRHATAEEIRAAYEISRHTFQENSLATYSLFTDAENQEILGLISKAYETLFNPEMRRAYDSQLDRQEPDLRGSRERRPGPAGPSPFAPTQAAPVHVPGPSAPAPVPPVHGPSALQPLPFAAVRRPVEDLGSRPAAAMGPPLPSMTLQASPGPAAPEIRATPPRPAPPTGMAREPSAQALEFAKNLNCFDGPSLKKLRQLHGITLEDLSERTKIRRAYLEYLEEEQFQFLPAAVYVKGFISIVAGILGVPAQRAAEDYMTRYNRPE